MSGVQERAGQRLTFLLSENRVWHHRPAYAEVVRRAHAAGLAGASVFRGLEGFGRGGRLHSSRLLSLAEDLPVAVVIVDSADRIQRFLPEVREVVDDALVLVESVGIISGWDSE